MKLQKPKRRPFLIREFLADQGLTAQDIARELGLSSSLVNETIRGIRNNRRVLVKLVEMGCPLPALALPENMTERKAAA